MIPAPFIWIMERDINMFTISDAKNVLRVDGDDNDDFIQSLVKSLPEYIEVTTGMSAEQQEKEPLVYTVSSFLITLWYYSDHADDAKLQRTIDNLLKCITLKAKRDSP